jgi:hypothetical protein
MTLPAPNGLGKDWGSTGYLCRRHERFYPAPSAARKAVTSRLKTSERRTV